MPGQSRILLTGASGWFGRSFTSEYIKHYSATSFQKLTLVTSDGRDLIHPMLPFKLKTVIFDEVNRLGNYDVIIQSSFLTRDKIEILGPEKYSQICESILMNLEKTIQNNPKAKIFLISSGAVYNDKSLYGKYKRIEELLVQQSENDFVILRIYGATTSYMDYRPWSAICDFIRSKMLNEDIYIKANHRIKRGIVCMEDLSRFIIKSIQYKASGNSDKIVCDAVSDIISIDELAHLFEGFNIKIRLPEKFDYTKIDDSYTGDPTEFLKLCDTFNIKLKNPQEQILNALNNYYQDSYCMHGDI